MSLIMNLFRKHPKKKNHMIVIGSSTGDLMVSLFHRSICNCRTVGSLRRKKKSQAMRGKQRDQEGRKEREINGANIAAGSHSFICL